KILKALIANMRLPRGARGGSAMRHADVAIVGAGLAGATAAAMLGRGGAGTGIDELWIARYGHLVEKRPGDQYGILYDTLVNTVRTEIPAAVEFIRAKVSALSTSPDRQTIALSNGEEISARLIVLATGLNNALRRSLGIVREELSKSHSISIGF